MVASPQKCELVLAVHTCRVQVIWCPVLWHVPTRDYEASERKNAEQHYYVTKS